MAQLLWRGIFWNRGPKRTTACVLDCIPISGGFYSGKALPDFFFFLQVLLRSEVESPSPSSVWGNHTDRRRRVVCGHPREWMHSDLPPSVLHPPSHVSLSLRRLHPWVWRWRSSAPSSGQNAGVSTAVPFLLPLFFPALLHLCLYLSLLLKMLSPSLVPQGSTWWKNKGERTRGNGGIGGKEAGEGRKKKGGRGAPDLKAER